MRELYQSRAIKVWENKGRRGVVRKKRRGVVVGKGVEKFKIAFLQRCKVRTLLSLGN